MKMKNSNLITKKDLMRTFWRSFTAEWSWNYERQMNLGYSFAVSYTHLTLPTILLV